MTLLPADDDCNHPTSRRARFQEVTHSSWQSIVHCCGLLLWTYAHFWTYTLWVLLVAEDAPVLKDCDSQRLLLLEILIKCIYLQ